MNQGASICKYTNIDKRYSIEDLAAFHGHLGPYIEDSEKPYLIDNFK